MSAFVPRRVLVPNCHQVFRMSLFVRMNSGLSDSTGDFRTDLLSVVLPTSFPPMDGMGRPWIC